MSTGLGDDASLAYQRLRRKARVLGTISRSFQTVTTELSAAYYAALRQPSPGAWSELVGQTASLVERTHALDGIVNFDTAECDALAFFEAILRENSDLLGARDADEPNAVALLRPIAALV